MILASKLNRKGKELKELANREEKYVLRREREREREIEREREREEKRE